MQPWAEPAASLEAHIHLVFNLYIHTRYWLHQVIAPARASFFSIISRTHCNGTSGSAGGWGKGNRKVWGFLSISVAESLLKMIWKKKRHGGGGRRRQLAGGCNAHGFGGVRRHQAPVLAVPQFPHPPCPIASCCRRLHVSPGSASCVACPSLWCLGPSWRQKFRQHFYREVRGEISPLRQLIFPLCPTRLAPP